MARTKGQWVRWFAWRLVAVATAEDSARWIWLEFVERKVDSKQIRERKKKWRYRLPQRLHNLAQLAHKLDSAQWRQSGTLK